MSTKNTSSSYLNAKSFFESIKPLGLTYDDVSLATQLSEVLPKNTNIETQLSQTITLPTPILSADMDTVTEAPMAIAMALQGGLGIIHYNMTEKEQLKHVAKVKNHIHGYIQEPIKINPDLYIADVLDLINSKGYKFSTFPVVDSKGKLLGMLSSRVVKDRFKNKSVANAMKSRDELHSISTNKLTKDPIKLANKFFNDNMGAHKLFVVDKNDHLKGLFTLSDIDRIINESSLTQKTARDDEFRLRCAAAIALTRTPEGSLDQDRILDHITNLANEGIDAIAISSAHAHTKDMGNAINMVRKNFKNLTIIAGNVTSSEGVEFLSKAGASAIKIGQGPGSICTTRIVAGVGIPQLTALYQASKASKKTGVKLIADGGINKSGDIVKALTLADAVICGGLLAGCKEAPGNIIEIDGKLYKEYRGMGSLQSMKQGSASRYGHQSKDLHRKVTAEGIEGLKELSGSVDIMINQLIGGIQSGLGYLGAKNLKELKQKARYVQVSHAGQRESNPHDVIELKSRNPSE